MGKMRKSELVIAGVILLSFASGLYIYPQMPEEIASHWNARGEVDGYISKFWGLFLVPLICTGLLLLFILIPKVDPLKSNIEEFRVYYDGFTVLVILFLFYLYLLTIYWNIDSRFNMIQFLTPAFGILFYYIGILLENAKRNWFIGIRTPWTLCSEKVWDSTHKISGKLFKITGGLAFLGAFFPSHALLFILAPVILVVSYATVYSYFEYQKETGIKGKPEK